MPKDEIIVSLERFSGSLLVVVFAVFAFTSGALIVASQIAVKVLFLVALFMAIISLVLSFRAISAPINFVLGSKSEQILNKGRDQAQLSKAEKDLKEKDHDAMKRKMLSLVKWQWRISLLALFLLALSVGSYMFTENIPSVKIHSSSNK